MPKRHLPSDPRRPFGGPLRAERREDGIVILWIDAPGARTNRLGPAFAHALEDLLDDLEAEARAFVVASAKPGGFVWGADVATLRGLRTASEAESLARHQQLAMDRLELAEPPVVAAIHGPCLGLGLELALACDARVGSDDEATRLGLPEVRVGLVPGAGGTQRLPALVGLEAGLELLLEGAPVSAARARALGLLDAVVPRPLLLEEAIATARRLADGERVRPRRSLLRRLADPGERRRLLREGHPLGRRRILEAARERLRARTRGLYPAPEAIHEAVRIGALNGWHEGLEAEAIELGRLLVGPEADALTGLELAARSLAAESGVDDPTVRSRRIAKMAVVDGGLTGVGVAYVTTARTSARVRLAVPDDASALAALRGVRRLVDEDVRGGAVGAVEADRRMARVTVTTDGSGLADADLVLVPAPDDPERARQTLRALEARARVGCVLAFGSGAATVGSLAEGSARPEHVVGLRYLAPAPEAPLLEVVTTARTAAWVTATCVALGKAQGKTVVVVRDGVGGYTSRILAPLVNEALHLVSEGVPVPVVDEALRDLGFVEGPLAVADEVGLPVLARVGRRLVEAFGMRLAPPDGLAALVAEGRRGRESGRGLYLYGGGERRLDPTVHDALSARPATGPFDAEALAWRCALPMVAEAARCFEEGVVRSARDGDMAAVLGLGFPPFRGGPFRLVDQMGAAELVRRLEGLATVHGKRFEPPELLVAMARTGHTFHGAHRARPGEIPRALATSPRAAMA